MIQFSQSGQLNSLKNKLRNDKEYEYIRDENNLSLLHISSKHGHFNIVKYLVEEKYMDMNIVNINNGWTSIIYASGNGHHQIVSYFLQQDKTLKKWNDEDKTIYIPDDIIRLILSFISRNRFDIDINYNLKRISKQWNHVINMYLDELKKGINDTEVNAEIEIKNVQRKRKRDEHEKHNKSKKYKTNNDK